jgi:hypothetical protein
VETALLLKCAISVGKAVFENRAQRRSERDVTGVLRNMHGGELCNLLASCIIIRGMKYRRVSCVEYIACRGNIKF